MSLPLLKRALDQGHASLARNQRKVCVARDTVTRSDYALVDSFYAPVDSLHAPFTIRHAYPITLRALIPLSHILGLDI